MSQCHDIAPDTGFDIAEGAWVEGAACHDAYDFEQFCLELTLAARMRKWAEQEAPGDEVAARTAVDLALWHFRAGASAEQASRQARRQVLGRLRHSAPRLAATRVAAS
jgi:hypothetical protein